MTLTSVFHFVPLFGNSETVTGKNALTSINSMKQCTVTCCYAFFRKTFSTDAFWSRMSLYLDRRHKTQCDGTRQGNTAHRYDVGQNYKLRNMNGNRNTRLISVFHFVPLFGNSETVTGKNAPTSINSMKRCTVTCCYDFFRETFSTDAL